MSISNEKYSKIITNLNVGNSVAEHDKLLEAARIETPVFFDFLNDKYDIVTGRKGAGKTAMFRIISEYLSTRLLRDRNLVILSGVNSNGETIFNKFKDEFAKFSEEDFEIFWKIYFISLIYNQFIKDPSYEIRLASLGKEISLFKNECSKAGIPEIPAKLNRPDILNWIIKIFSNTKSIKVPIAVGQGDSQISLMPQIDFKEDQSISLPSSKMLYINSIGEVLGDILSKSNYKIWIILDRLDEVFERYSSVEFNGLRGLLRAYKSFDLGSNKDLFRIKIFLRDDIKTFLTENDSYRKYFKNKVIPPLPAATHIFSKESPVLSWNEDEIQQLILQRLLLSKDLREYLGMKTSNEDEIKQSLKDKKLRIEYWNKIFPEKISSSSSLRWIYSHLKDSNGVVTPRSIIDMLEAIIEYQKKTLVTNLVETNILFPLESIKQGIDQASKNKLEKDVYNEFPSLQIYIKQLERQGKYKLSKPQLIKIYGKNWEAIVNDLMRIGILEYIKYSDQYRIVFLFRPALNIAYKH